MRDPAAWATTEGGGRPMATASWLTASRGLSTSGVVKVRVEPSHKLKSAVRGRSCANMSMLDWESSFLVMS